MQSRRYKPVKAARRAYSRGYGRSREEEGGPRIRTILLCALVALALYLRFSPGETPQAVRQTVASLFGGDMDLKEAVAVLGRQVAGQEDEEDTLLVFGKKLLGQDGEESGEEEEKTEKQETQEEDQGNAADYQEPSQGEIDEISPESAQIEKTAGVKTGRLFLWQSETGGVCEAPYPAWEVSQLQLIWGKGEESADSSLPEEVDGNTYTFSAPCAAPLQGVVTSPYGWRDHPIGGEYKFHHGVDIGAGMGTPIGSFAGGTVLEVGVGTVYGNYALVDHGDGFTSFYGHMDSVTVKEGQQVEVGQEIGKVGSTGQSTGPHLHFQMKKNGKIIDPNDYVKLGA